MDKGASGTTTETGDALAATTDRKIVDRYRKTMARDGIIKKAEALARARARARAKFEADKGTVDAKRRARAKAEDRAWAAAHARARAWAQTSTRDTERALAHNHEPDMYNLVSDLVPLTLATFHSPLENRRSQPAPETDNTEPPGLLSETSSEWSTSESEPELELELEPESKQDLSRKKTAPSTGGVGGQEDRDFGEVEMC